MASLWPADDDGDFSVPDFLESPLVHWALSLSGHGGPNSGNNDQMISPASRESLCSSMHFLKDLLDQIEPPLLSHETTAWQDDPVLHRLTVLESLVTGLDSYFTDTLGQIMILRPPDILLMCQFPGTDRTISEMRKLLLLILSFAVQSGRKEEIIERIQSMEEDVQKGIVECIKEVTDNPARVWKVELLELVDMDHEHDRQLLLVAHQHIRALLGDRQELLKLAVTLWRESYRLKATAVSGGPLSKLPASSSQAVEVADLKTQIRRVMQELYECQEELKECREELKTASTAVQNLQEERGNLEKETRLVKVYRDELDLLYEKDKTTQKLENELSRYRGQLVELEYYKNRIEELEQNWKLLTDTKNLLESQLDSARKRTEVIPQLENELCLMRHDLQNAVLQNNSHKDQVEDLLVANTQLSLELRRYRRDQDGGPVPDGTHDDVTGIGLSLSEQLHESLSSKVLRLEMENEQLRASEAYPHGQATSCRHCLEKDSGTGTVPTSEDTCSTGESSVETDPERHLESDPGYDTIDFKFSSGLTDAAPGRHIKSTQFLLNHVFDNSTTLLREENLRLKEEVALLESLVRDSRKEERKVDQERKSALIISQNVPQLSDQIAPLQNAKTQLEQANQSLEESLVNERRCLEEICTFLTSQGITLPEKLSETTGTQKVRSICEKIAEAFARRESEALQRSHSEILTELESLKAEYEQLRTAHNDDVRKLQSQHTEAVSSINASHRAETQRTATENRENSEALRRQHETDLLNLRITHDGALRSLRNAPSSITIATSSDANQRLENEVRSLSLTNSTLKKTLLEQEKIKEGLAKAAEASQAAHSSVMSDHESLQLYHQQLNTDYEKMSKEVFRLKGENKKFSAELEEAKRKSGEVSARLTRDAEGVREERLKRLEAEYGKLVEENDGLRKANRELGSTYRVLTEEHKEVKTEVRELKLKKIEYEGVVFDCQNQVYSKEIEANKHTEILLGIIASLEDEKRSFAAAIERLVLQYDDVFLHSWREKNEMKSEHKDLQDKLHALDMQKQLLIQKLYDTYKATEARKQNISFMKRVRQAAGGLVGRSRSRGQSRTRTISPTDSAADSSSVESNGPSHEYKTSKPVNSASMHSLKTLDSKNGPQRTMPQLSYSSEDLCKQGSSASSYSMSSTTDQPAARPAFEEPSPALTDPAFHRAGSRRGVYRPHSHTTVVVHHPAIKEAESPLNSPLPVKNERRASVTDSVKSGERRKKCCDSYGGFHDCTMLNYARLSATASLTGERRASVDSQRREEFAAGDRASLSGSSTQTEVPIRLENTPPPYRCSPNSTVRQIRNIQSESRPDSTANKRVTSVRTTESIYSQPRAIRPLEATPPPEARKAVDSGLSSWSFSASFNSVNYPREAASVSSTKYFVSDQPVAGGSNGAGDGDKEENQVWFEYGCV